MKAVGNGLAVVTVSAGNVHASCEIRVFDSALVLPESLEVVPEEGFVSTSVVCVECPQMLRVIEKRAFADCSMLERIRMYEGVQSIAVDAFENSPNVVISAPVGSYAIKWAIENGVSYLEE